MSPGGGDTKESTAMTDVDVSDPPEKLSSESSGMETSGTESTKATEENDSDDTIEAPASSSSEVPASSSASDEKKDGDDGDGNDAGSTEDKTPKENDSRTQEEKDKETKEKEEADKKRIEELKIKYKDWPLRAIKEPHDNDVMYGRGGGTNHHQGNKRYRKMVEDNKLKYVNSKRLDKPLVALGIIREWRGQWPPGRFLKFNEKAGGWEDVGDKKAREKTSQALREKAPQIRQQQAEEKNEEDGAPGDDNKTTRFAEGTKDSKKSTSKMKKAILARDHSLGREYLASDEAVSISDFTWQDPFKKGGKRDASLGSLGSATDPQPPPNTGPGAAPFVPPPGRNDSMGSVGMPFMHGGPNQLPSPPDYYGRVSNGESRREYSNGSIGSWGAAPYPPYPGGPPPPPGGPTHQRSGSWTHPQLPPSPHHHGAHHQRSGSWNGGGGREHSFSFNPLPGANTNRPAPTEAFDHRGSGYWGEQMFPPGAQGAHPPPQPPPPGPYGGGYASGGSMPGSMGPPQPGPYRQLPSPPHSNTPSPPYNVMNIARTWSGGGAPPPAPPPPPPPPPHSHSQYDVHPQSFHDADTSPQRGAQLKQNHLDGAVAGTNGHIPRPTMVKRDTSNQNETYETKPSRIKRAALNRDQSATSNRLKQEYIPEIFNRDMKLLQENTEQIRLSPGLDKQPLERPKPRPLGQEGRVSTMEAMTDFMDKLDEIPLPKPSSLSGEGRMNTIDALGFDLDDGSDLLNNNNNNTDDDQRAPPASSTSLPKPFTLTPANRLSTSEFLDIVNAPFVIQNDNEPNNIDEDPLPL